MTNPILPSRPMILAMVSGGQPPMRVNLNPGLQRMVSEYSRPMVSRVGAAAFVKIDGPLMNDTGWLYDSVECLTHGGVCAVLGELESDPTVATIVLDLNCGGWGVNGSSDTLTTLERVGKSKRLMAFVHDGAFSGGVWMACMCEEITSTPTGMIGSIGSMMLAYDSSEAYKEMGVEPVVVASDPDKASGWPGVPISETTRASWQRSIDVHTTAFFAAVSTARGVPTEAIAAMKAHSFDAADALANKLIDRIENIDVYKARVGSLPPMVTTKKGATPPQTAPQARKERTMDFATLTVADLKTNAGTLVAQIETEAVNKAVKSLEDADKAPATFDALSANFGDDAAFILQCQKDKLSISDATAKYIGKLKAENATQATALEAANKKDRREGDDTITPSGGDGGKAKFEDMVRTTALKDSVPLSQAVYRVGKARPDLRKEWADRGSPVITA